MAKFAFLIAILVIAGVTASRIDTTTECLNDIEELVSLMPQINGEVQQFDLGSLIQDGLRSKEILKRTVRDCSSGNFLKFLNKTTLQGPAECIQDIIALVPEIQKLMADIETGDFAKIIEDIQKLIPLVQKTIKDCSQTKKINPRHVLNFFNTPQCQKVHAGAKDDVLNLIYAFKTKNVDAIVTSFPSVVSRVRNILETCSVAPESSTVYNFLEDVAPQNDACSDDIAAIVALIPQLIDHLQAGDIAAVIQDVTQLYSLLQKASEDCFQAVQTIQPFDYVNQTTVQDFAKCIQDIMAIIPKFQQLIADIAEGNFTVIINDIIALVPLVNQTIIDCGDAKKTTSVKYLINFYKSSECIEKIHAVRASIINMHMYIENRQTVKFQSKVPELVNLVKSTVQVCHKRRL